MTGLGKGGGGGNYKGDERRVDRVGKNRREEERVSFDNRGKMSDVDMGIITKKKRETINGAVKKGE